MTPRSTTGATALVLVAGLALSSGCTTSPADPTRPPSHGELRLVSFDSCEQAAEELRAAASEYLTAWSGGGMLGAPGLAEDDSAGADGAAPEAARAGAPDQAQDLAPAGPEAAQSDPDAAQSDPDAPAHSGTNVHEAGVDEPDLVKTDGRRIVTVSQGTLRVVDAARRVPTGTLDLFPDAGADDPARWAVTDLLLHGDRALVLVGETYFWQEPIPGAEQGTEPVPVEPPIAGPRLLLVDLAGSPQMLGEYTMDGGLVDARAVGSTVRVVVRSAPRLSVPELDYSMDEAERRAWTQAAIDATELSDWLPRYQLTVDDQTSTGQVDCTALSRPASYSGTSMLTVLTFDLAEPALGDGAPVTVVADGETVYSNGPSLYIANDQRWMIGPMPMFRGDDILESDDTVPQIDDRTVIHKFDTSEPGQPRYIGSGSVEGWLINQYAMSEWDGHLRVATTSGETWWGESADTESTVYTLTEQADELVEVGSVGGLGEGERIYSVRFAGPVGYVVTFRETDPLYTVDLSDPANPTVLGELKITGYSAYLHPIDQDRLIGIGQEADLEGRTQGTQVSLFDVSDLTDPQVLGQHHVQYGHSEAEFDPHAFLWWPAERLLVVPLSDYDGNSGALVLRLDGDEFTELDQISHPPTDDWSRSGYIRRSLVIEDTLWTLSDAGLAAHSLSTLDQLAWLPF